MSNMFKSGQVELEVELELNDLILILIHDLDLQSWYYFQNYSHYLSTFF